MAQPNTIQGDDRILVINLDFTTGPVLWLLLTKQISFEELISRMLFLENMNGISLFTERICLNVAQHILNHLKICKKKFSLCKLIMIKQYVFSAFIASQLYKCFPSCRFLVRIRYLVNRQIFIQVSLLPSPFCNFYF